MLKKIVRLVMGNDAGREVSNKELLRYAMGIAGQNITYGLVANWFFYYCSDVAYLDIMAIGVVLGAARIWDAINDPLVGIFIDRHTFKNGEKMRPYLKWFALPIGVATMLMFTDVGLEGTAMLVFITAMYFLWDILYSFQDIAQWGMTARITTSSEERGRVAQFARIGGMVGGWLPGLIPLMVANYDKIGITESQLFAILGALFGVGGMAISMFAYSAKERATVTTTKGSISNDYKLLFKNKLAMLLVLGNILSSVTFYVDSIYFFKYMVHLNLFGYTIDGITLGFVFGLVVGLPGGVGIFFAHKMSKKVGGMRNVLLIAVVLDVVCRIAAYFVGFDGYRILVTGVLLMVAGIPNNMRGVACTTLWGDSIDYMEWKTGQRNEGVVFAMQNFVAKITRGISTFFMSVSLSIIAFDSSRYEAGIPQEASFYKYIWPIFMLGPALGSLLYAIPLLFIKYNLKERNQIEQDLKIIRENRERCTNISLEEQLVIDIYQ